jgi:predicted ATP-dependent serine protease
VEAARRAAEAEAEAARRAAQAEAKAVRAIFATEEVLLTKEAKVQAKAHKAVVKELEAKSHRLEGHLGRRQQEAVREHAKCEQEAKRATLAEQLKHRVRAQCRMRDLRLVVGLAEAAVRESRTRVRAAIEQSGYPFPIRRVTVNLAPADVRKAGTGFDLAIAIATLAAAGECAAASLDRWMMLGELSLTGGVRGVRGVLPQVMAARERGVRGAIVATENLAEAAVVEGIEVLGADSLRDVVEVLAGRGELRTAAPRVP